MITFSIRLEAVETSRNIARLYLIDVGFDLFDDWVVWLTNGRIGSPGRVRTFVYPSEAEAAREVEKVLKQRFRAPKRIGIPYVVKQIHGTLANLDNPFEIPDNARVNSVLAISRMETNKLTLPQPLVLPVSPARLKAGDSATP